MSGGARRRVRVSLEGVVQGVGFRPFVHRLAARHDLAGWVRNDARGVELEAEGDELQLGGFLRDLLERPPPLAAVERVRARPLAARAERGFRILGSAGRAEGPAAGAPAAGSIPPDIATCDACLREMLDPDDRRHRYPFINCTDCGPRFTIVRRTPYDRPLTTMAAFAMCDACRAEYEDPSSRRFHAEPNACPGCGPALRLLDGAGRPAADGEDPLAAAGAALGAGAILAVKGVGGYQLACRADDERAVAELRRRKGRDEKPLALMVRDLAAMERLVELSPRGAELASSPERPIVVSPRRPDAPVAEAVAPGLRELGVMLASTPLHHLLAREAGTALVMTSGNVGGEPIVHEDARALAQLGPIADLLLVHDRAIHVRADDPVVRAAAGPAIVLRRARGQVPRGIALPAPAPPLLACGAELKSTFCLARGPHAWVGPHVGDLRSLETMSSFEQGVAHFEELLGLRPEVVVHDLHPDYLSSAYAQRREGVELVAVQHHHAHLAAVLAEHGHAGPVVGAIYDGTGLGSDGTAWGGELLAGDLAQARRVGHLRPVPLPGGDAAARQTWRMACSWLAAALGGPQRLPRRLAGRIEQERWEQVARLARTGLASPPTTSVGRLFDAVAALCGIRLECSEDGLAAMELEAAADPGEEGAYPLEVLAGGETVLLDPQETVRAIVAELDAGVAPALVSARFHNGLADATAAALSLLGAREGVSTAVLAGGVFQNALLLGRCLRRLRRAGFSVLLARRLPPGDGGISYGQAAVAAARLAGAGAG